MSETPGCRSDNEPGRLPQCHAEQHLHRQAGLDGSFATVRLSVAFAGRHITPGHLGIKPDLPRAATLERCVVVRPVPGGRVANAVEIPLRRNPGV